MAADALVNGRAATGYWSADGRPGQCLLLVWLRVGERISGLLPELRRAAPERLAGTERLIPGLSDVAIDGSLQKSPCSGGGTGKNRTDRAKLGWSKARLTDIRTFGWGLKVVPSPPRDLSHSDFLS